MRYITTYTGRRLDPLAPQAEALDIRDIAHALSLQCRGNGHVHCFFSVGQHCINCAREALARGLGSRAALACLLHDGAEAYLSDVPRPLKQQMPGYRAAEDALQALVYAAFLGGPLTPAEQAQVKAIDDDLLYYDLTELLAETPAGPAPVLCCPQNRDFVPFAQVEAEYLALYRRLKAETA